MKVYRHVSLGRKLRVWKKLGIRGGRYLYYAIDSKEMGIGSTAAEAVRDLRSIRSKAAGHGGRW